MNIYFKSAILILTIWTNTHFLYGQGRLVGRLLGSDKKPVIAATVYVVSPKFTQATITNAFGYFTFFDVPVGDYQLKTYKRGLPLLEKSLQVKEGLSRIDLSISDQVASLETPSKTVKKPKRNQPTSKPAPEKTNKPEPTKTLATDEPDSLDEEGATDESDIETISEQDLAKEEGLKESFENAKTLVETEKTKVDKRPEIIGGMPALNSKIMYPTIAREKGTQGAVIARVNVDKNGKITKVTISKSSDPSFSEEVFRVLSDDVQFQPAQLNNQPVASVVTVLIEFKLQ